ncbi:MAG: GAF domain-containing protein [Bdellovibrionota bacterium]
MGINSIADLKKDFCRLACFGANITDSHSCFIFLPQWILQNDLMPQAESNNELALVGFHSLSSEIFNNCHIEAGNGVIGWVAQHKQSIHIAPFERDSRTLGMYRAHLSLKSVIAVPIMLDCINADTSNGNLAGVLACDSKKSYAFSKLQGKLLEDLSYEISNTLRLSMTPRAEGQQSWCSFIQRGMNLISTLGKNSVDVLRVHPENLDAIEIKQGTSETITAVEQLYRLIQQSLSQEFPSYCLPNGDLIIILDNMMSAFYQNKIDALAKYVARGGETIVFSYLRQSFSDRQNRTKTLDDLIAATNSTLKTESTTTSTKRSYVFGRR